MFALSPHPTLPQVPGVLNLGLFSQYSRLIGRVVCTPGLAIVYEACFAATCAHFLDPLHAMALQLLLFGHSIAITVSDSVMTPYHRDAPVVEGSATWLEVALLSSFGLIFLVVVGYVYGDQMERLRRSDAQLRARALALHVSTERLVRNFLPAAVLTAVNRRAVDGGGNEADIVAWSFDPACVLQSAIVGFTALGSRISPEALCGCGLASFPLISICLLCISSTSFSFYCILYHLVPSLTSFNPMHVLQISARPLLAV